MATKTAGEIFARASTATLCTALETLAAKAASTREEDVASAELITEIERRVPAAEQAVTELFETDETADRAAYIRTLLTVARASLGGAR
jgi:hypothetical protein